MPGEGEGEADGSRSHLGPRDSAGFLLGLTSTSSSASLAPRSVSSVSAAARALPKLSAARTTASSVQILANISM